MKKRRKGLSKSYIFALIVILINLGIDIQTETEVLQKIWDGTFDLWNIPDLIMAILCYLAAGVLLESYHEK